MPRGLAAASIWPSSSRAEHRRPSDQSPPISARWPRRVRSSQHRPVVAAFQHHLSGPRDARPEAAGPVFGVEAGGVDGLLRRHVVVDHAQEEDQRPLVLLLAAWRAEGHPGGAVVQGEAGGQRGARPLARHQAVGQAGLEPEHLAARAHREAQAGNDRGGLQPSARRRGADHVAPAVDHVQVAGVGADHAQAGHGGFAGARGAVQQVAAQVPSRSTWAAWPGTVPGRSSRFASPVTRSRRSSL